MRLTMKDLFSVLGNFSSKRIAVIGDIMLDHYLEGKFTRTSPEALTPIVLVEKEWFAPGGAGNTAMNIRRLEAKPLLFGRMGNDAEAVMLLEKFTDADVQLDTLPDSIKTITKNRIIVEKQHVTRFDCEFKGSKSDVSKLLEGRFLDIFKLFSARGDCDAILVSDYDKGLITENMARGLVDIAKKRQKVLIVDTKPKHFLWFRGCYCIKPNRIEAEEFSGVKIESHEDAKKAGLKIKKELETNVLLTLGSMGMMLFEEGGSITHFTSSAKEVFDVTGAGDTVLATFGLALASGASMRQAADLANHAAAIVIAKQGTASVSLEELKKSIS